MIPCPLCGHENIEGVDTCDQCGQPLDDLHVRDPKNAVERGILKDTAAEIEASPPIAVRGETTVGSPGKHNATGQFLFAQTGTPRNTSTGAELIALRAAKYPLAQTTSRPAATPTTHRTGLNE